MMILMMMMKITVMNKVKMMMTKQPKLQKYEGIAFLQEEILFSIQDKLAFPSSWILLDSQSTVDSLQPKTAQ